MATPVPSNNSTMNKKRFLLETAYFHPEIQADEVEALELFVKAIKKTRRYGHNLCVLFENSIKMAMIDAFAAAVFEVEGNHLSVVTADDKEIGNIYTTEALKEALAELYDPSGADKRVLTVNLYNDKKEVMGDVEFDIAASDINEFARHTTGLEDYLEEAWGILGQAFPV